MNYDDPTMREEIELTLRGDEKPPWEQPLETWACQPNEVWRRTIFQALGSKQPWEGTWSDLPGLVCKKFRQLFSE